jgi:hypothetical protein
MKYFEKKLTLNMTISFNGSGPRWKTNETTLLIWKKTGGPAKISQNCGLNPGHVQNQMSQHYFFASGTAKMCKMLQIATYKLAKTLSAKFSNIY